MDREVNYQQLWSRQCAVTQQGVLTVAASATRLQSASTNWHFRNQLLIPKGNPGTADMLQEMQPGTPWVTCYLL